MQTVNDVHEQFAGYFGVPALFPYAYLLSRKISEGHICLDLDSVATYMDTPGLPAACYTLQPGAVPLKKVEIVGQDGDTSQPFVLFNNRLYLQRYFRYETNFLRRITGLIEGEKETLGTRTGELESHRPFISRLFETAKENPLPHWQLAAAVTGVLNNITIITGGPGTGKTTTVARMLAILYTIYPGLRVALAAPTGKAAARLGESLRKATLPVDKSITEKLLELKPSTIHRLLKTIRDTPYFQHNAGNPLNYDVVIVDECSMIDVALFAKLLDAIGDTTRLVLLGDKDQLASVEAGSLFGDLCQAQPVLNLFSAGRAQVINSFITDEKKHIPASPVQAPGEHPLFEHLVELRESYRFTSHEGIGKFSHAVINSDTAAINEFLVPGADGQVMIDTGYSSPLFTQFITGYEKFIREKDIRKALQEMNRLRVLCAVREGEQGLYATNKAIEKHLHANGLVKLNAIFYEHRPIILTRNYYEHGLFNGDTGIIRTDANGILMAWFEDAEGELKAVLPGYLTEAETAFAMTIHKSQGSEFDEVLVILPPTDAPIMTRELVYTAVTRARKKVYVQAPAEVLLRAAARFVERASGIAARFNK